MEIKTKNCERCSKEFELNGKGHNKLYCSKACKVAKAKIRSRNVKYVKNIAHNSLIYENQKIRALARKREFIAKKGGCCNSCGYKKNIACLCFHHIDPSLKLFNLDGRKISNTTMPVLLEELEKCILLCHNCHTELHHPQLDYLL